jgi:N6-adenosine-specific RNA methylase IME4
MAKKLTKAQRQILEGLYHFYNSKGDSLVVVGDDKKTKINDKGLMFILDSFTKKEHSRFTEETKKLAEKLGLKLEVKTVIKLI